MSITKYRCAILMYSVGGFSCFQSLITSMYGIVVPSKIKEKKKHSLIQPLPHSSPAASIYAENMELEMWWGHTAICWLEWLRLSLERLCPLEFPLVLSRLVFLSTVHKKGYKAKEEVWQKKNKRPLQHPAIQHTQHVFPYILGYDAWCIKRPLRCGRHATPSMISIMAIMEDRTICY